MIKFYSFFIFYLFIFIKIDQVQVGFGWTNGLTLWILNNFNDIAAPNCNATGTYQVPESF